MQATNRRFEDRVALVTGAASGIGRATALRLAAEGARVACLDLEIGPLAALEKEIAAAGGEALAIRGDVSVEADARGGVERALARFGALHVLCNVAGILRFSHSHEVALADWQRVLAVNLTGTFLLCREAIPALLATRGAIVNTSSTAAIGAHPWTAAYSASKGGILALTRTLAIEYVKQGLRVNAVCPGNVQTPMHAAFRLPDGADTKLMRRMLPLDGFRGPEVVAGAIAFLASDDAGHVTGEELRVDGGLLA